jgi:phosphate starvation-inducible protein PhoH
MTTTFYKHVVVDFPHLYMKQVVGKKGYNLKQCCSKTGVDSVWFNMKRNIVEIYGPSVNLEKANEFLEERMKAVRSKVPVAEMEEYKKQYTFFEDSTITGSLDGALDKSDVKYLIGKKGKHFKRITKESNVSFIWYDEINHNVIIYGPQYNLDSAIKMLFSQIEKVKKKKTDSDSVEFISSDVEMV